MIHLTDTEKAIIKILAHNLHKPLHAISTRKEFFTELSMDETDYLLTLVDIEKQFHIDIPDEVAFTFRSARQIIEYLGRQKAAA